MNPRKASFVSEGVVLWLWTVPKLSPACKQLKKASICAMAFTITHSKRTGAELLLFYETFGTLEHVPPTLPETLSSSLTSSSELQTSLVTHALEYQIPAPLVLLINEPIRQQMVIHIGTYRNRSHKGKKEVTSRV